ncbi:MAG: glycosyltransferase family 1 protein [Cyanobacteria bacterium P01_D01_bin.1]
MKVCLDTTPVTQQPSGVGLYILNLIDQLAQQQVRKDLELHLIYQPQLINWLKGTWQFPSQLQRYDRKQVLPVPVRLLNLLIRLSPVLTGELLTRYLESVDIVHGTGYSVYPSGRGARVMTVYDVSFALYPEYATSVSRSYYSAVKRCLQWTDLVITISESSKQDIMNCFQIPAERVWVTPLASRYPILPSNSDEVEQDESRQFGGVPKAFLSGLNRHAASPNLKLDRPYLLFVGTLEPRKNITAIIQAFDQLKSGYGVDHQLLLVGRRGWLYEPIFAAIQQSSYRDYIHQLDYVAELFMSALYQNATAFVYPSYYEGFGLPVLESMSLGCPVVSSNASSIPEVAGDAAILVPPDDVDALADALYRLIESPSLRRHYVRAGYEQVRKFSWAKTAQSTIAAYCSLMP